MNIIDREELFDLARRIEDVARIILTGKASAQPVPMSLQTIAAKLRALARRQPAPEEDFL